MIKIKGQPGTASDFPKQSRKKNLTSIAIACIKEPATKFLSI